ncbi:hypothetical protein [Providencia sp. Je.9.19]|uniref:hypothetical protein n=1 Tax=unclassified Providencia TaxID=2633465 RepID=UPI003DA8F60C
MMNTHFLYLLGHLRLLEEQHSLVSLNRVGIGLIGSTAYNHRYMQAINHSSHHCELKAVCEIDSAMPSASYFMCQKRKIENLINNEEISSVIITSVYSDELLKFTIHTAVDAGKDILLNNIPNYCEDELSTLLKLAKLNGVNISHSHPISFETQFCDLNLELLSEKNSEAGLLRLSAHRKIEPDDRIPFNTLRAVISDKVSLLLTLLPSFTLSTASIQYSHPFSKMEDGDVLIINLRTEYGLLISFELFFNTGNISDRLSLKQRNHNFQFENNLITEQKNHLVTDDDAVIKQLDQFVLKLRSETKQRKATHFMNTNLITENILGQLKLKAFI